MTLVNLQLTALALPGVENSSKNHSDGHRLLNFALTLQETLKGRDLYLCGWATLLQGGNGNGNGTFSQISL